MFIISLLSCIVQQCLKYSITFSLVSFIYWVSENIYWMNNSLNKIIETGFAVFSLIDCFIYSVFIHAFILQTGEAIPYTVQEKLFLLFVTSLILQSFWRIYALEHMTLLLFQHAVWIYILNSIFIPQKTY